MSVADKKRKNMIVMLSALVLVVLLLVVVKMNSGEDDGVESTSVSYPLTTLKPGQIATITYEYKDGARASYKYTDGQWLNADDINFPLSSTAFDNQFVAKFIQMTATRKVTEFEGGLEGLGLAEPELCIDVTAFNGTTTNYKVGKYNKTMDEYYLMIDNDENQIYMVNDELIYICRDDIYDFATVESFPKYSTSTLNYLQFQSGENISKLKYSKDGFEEDITGYDWNWAFTAPFDKLMPCESSRMETFEEDTLSNFEFSKTVNYKATEEELAEYGLDNPRGSYSVFFVETDEEGVTHNCSITIYIGNLCDEESGYYTRKVETVDLDKKVSNSVVILPSAYAEEILGLNPLEYMLTNVFYLEIKDIENTEIIFTTKNNEFSFSFDDGPDDQKVSDDIYTMEGKEVDSEGFRKLWTDMVSLEPERVIYDKTTLSKDEPAYTIYADRNKEDAIGDMTITFVKYDSTYYQVCINGATDTLMRKTKVDEFFANVDTFGETYK